MIYIYSSKGPGVRFVKKMTALKGAATKLSTCVHKWFTCYIVILGFIF